MTQHKMPAIILLSLNSLCSLGVTVFMDDFESDSLDLWTGKNNGAYSGVVVIDPLDPVNHVLAFTEKTVQGDVFTKVSYPLVSGSSSLHLQFDYLGLQSGPLFPSENLGGFAGIAFGYFGSSSRGAWVAGTEPTAVNGLGILGGVHLIDDGTWHHYDIDLSTYADAFFSANGTLDATIMLEDWSFSPGSTSSPAGDAYFDNIVLSLAPDPVPESGSTRQSLSFAFGAIAAACICFRRRG